MNRGVGLALAVVLAIGFEVQRTWPEGGPVLAALIIGAAAAVIAITIRFGRRRARRST